MATPGTALRPFMEHLKYLIPVAAAAAEARPLCVAVTTLGKWKGRGHAATGVGTLVICKYFNGTSQKTPKEQGKRSEAARGSRMGTRKP